MFLDLDRFKPVNDTFGHEAGDVVLTATANRLSEAVRSGDTVARFGGDEFLVLCEDVGDLDSVIDLSDRIRHAVSERIPLPDPSADVSVSVSVGLSIGLVLVDRPGIDAEALVRQADSAMYRAKRNGGGRTEVIDDRTSARIRPGTRSHRRPLTGPSRPRRRDRSRLGYAGAATRIARSSRSGRRRRGRRARPGPRRCRRRADGRPSGCAPGVADSRAMRPCIGTPSTSTIDPRAAMCGSAAMSAMSCTGAAAAWASSKAASTSSRSRAADPRGHRRVELVAVGSTRPANVWKRSSSPTPTRSSTRRATDSADVRHRHPPVVGACGRCRGAPSRGCPSRAGAAGSRAARSADGSGPISWNSDSSRFTSTTWPTPAVHRDHRGEGGDQRGDLVGEGDRRQQRARRRARR